MSISDHQERLTYMSRTISIALLRAREAVMEHYRPMLKKHGVTEQQWRTMRILQELGPLEASHLAELACVLNPSLTRILKNLEAQGFIQTSKDKHDARKTIVSLSQAGDAFIMALTPQSKKAFGEIQNKVGAQELEDLLDRLNAFSEKLKG